MAAVWSGMCKDCATKSSCSFDFHECICSSTTRCHTIGEAGKVQDRQAGALRYTHRTQTCM